MQWVIARMGGLELEMAVAGSSSVGNAVDDRDVPEPCEWTRQHGSRQLTPGYTARIATALALS